VFLSSTPGDVIDQAATVARHGARYIVVADVGPFQRSPKTARDGSKRSLIRWAKEPFHAMPTVRRHARTAAHESRSAVSLVT
jgi:hypothetical protein